MPKASDHSASAQVVKRHRAAADYSARQSSGMEAWNGYPADALGGDAVSGERLIRRRRLDISRRRGSSFLDLGEQPGLNRGGCPLSLCIIMGETTGLEDYGAQLSDAAATNVVEVHKRKAGPGHCVLQQRDYRCLRQAMFAA